MGYKERFAAGEGTGYFWPINIFGKNQLEKLVKVPGGHPLFGLSLWIRGTQITKGHPEDNPKAAAIRTPTLDRGSLPFFFTWTVFGGKTEFEISVAT